MSKTQIPHLPPEMIEHILKRSYSSTLQNCLEIKYLAEFAQKELDKRYQRCLKVLIELGMNEVEAKYNLAKGKIYLYNVCMKVTDTSITALAENCSGLTEIYLSFCYNITDTSVTALANNCSGLTTIYLSLCSNITDTAKQLLRDYLFTHNGIGLWERDECDCYVDDDDANACKGMVN